MYLVAIHSNPQVENDNAFPNFARQSPVKPNVQSIVLSSRFDEAAIEKQYDQQKRILDSKLHTILSPMMTHRSRTQVQTRLLGLVGAKPHVDSYISIFDTSSSGSPRQIFRIGRTVTGNLSQGDGHLV